MLKQGEIVVIKELIKSYGKEKVLDIDELRIQKGKIYGIVGDNGAGKTTLFKMMSGIDVPTSGTVEYETNSIKKGALFEKPAMDPELTGYENLKFVSLLNGYKGDEKIHELLMMVGLEGSERKKVKKYSLGMKQRLGIAMTLLGEPEILFLDEPLNGIDPHGVVDFRNVIKHVNSKGVTVLISSHILSELNKLASVFLVIRNGRIIKELSEDEILKLQNDRYVLKTDDDLSAADCLRRINEKVTLLEDGGILIEKTEVSEEIISYIKDNGIAVLEYYKYRFDLESYYEGLL